MSIEICGLYMRQNIEISVNFERALYMRMLKTTFASDRVRIFKLFLGNDEHSAILHCNSLYTLSSAGRPHCKIITWPILKASSMAGFCPQGVDTR